MTSSWARMMVAEQQQQQTQLAQVPLGQPRIRWSDLTRDSPGYFKALAAPSNDTLVIMWWILSMVNLIDSLIVAIVFGSIMSDRKARRSPFNVYLLFLMFPDFLYSFLCFVTCLLCALKGEYWSPSMCRGQAVYLVFSTAANSWINALTTYEIHVLLKRSNRRARYFPPTVRQVCIRSTIVYIYSLFLSLWIFIDGPWGLHEVDALYGFVCLPVQFTVGASMFWYLIFVPLFMGIPLIYILWVLYDIYRNRLLPPSGKRRELTIYFFRLTFIFIGFWMPTVLVYYIFRGMHPWGMFAFGVWTHSAGGVAALYTAQKPDVQRAVRRLLAVRCSWCCWRLGDFDDNNDSVLGVGDSRASRGGGGGSGSIFGFGRGNRSFNNTVSALSGLNLESSRTTTANEECFHKDDSRISNDHLSVSDLELAEENGEYNDTASKEPQHHEKDVQEAALPQEHPRAGVERALEVDTALSQETTGQEPSTPGYRVDLTGSVRYVHGEADGEQAGDNEEHDNNSTSPS